MLRKEVPRLILMHRSAAVTLALIVVHQSLIASSAYFLTQAIEGFQRGADYALFLLGYFASMTLPFLPGCASFYSMQCWANAAHARFVDHTSQALHARVAAYKNRNGRENVESVLSRNSFAIINGYVAFLHDACSFSLNSLLSIFVLALLLPPELLAGYIASFVLSLALIAALSPRLRHLAQQTEARHAAYGEVLGRCWDNAVLGNPYNFGLWTQARLATGSNYYRSLLATTALRQIGNGALGIAALLPTATLIYLSIRSGDLDAAVVAAVIVNLTRIFHILNSLSSLIYQVLEFGGMHARLAYLLDAAPAALRSPAPAHPAPKAPIFINDRPVRDYGEAVAFLSRQTAGRFTLRGQNGSGKSTLLLALKASCGPNAMLMPRSLDGLHWRGDHALLSTGQCMVQCMDEALLHGAFGFLLLDEWDANLDTGNRSLIDARLDTVSQTKVVVEVRH